MGIGLGVGINRSNYAQGIFSAYQSRVVADGGITEAGNCVNAVSSLLQSASLLIIPSGYKGGKAYAEIPTNGNGDLTWTRASDAWRTNADGLIQRVPWNLLQYSEDFSNATWLKQDSTITTNTTNAPNGTLTADTMVEGTGVSTQHRVRQSATISSGASYTASVYIKRLTGTRDFAIINVDSGQRIYYNMTTNTVANTISGSGTITNVGDGWYRLTASGTSTSTSTFLFLCMCDGTSSTSETYTGNGTSSFAIWGAQLVEGSSAQTYFPTTDRLNVPRLSYMYGSCPALLLEPQRTNSIRNSTMVGASTGVSGTNPTNWGALGTAGLTYEITSLGTEKGVNYIDYKFSGTAAGSVVRVIFEGTAQIVASNGQTWTPSVYAKTISGAYDAAAIGLIQRNSVGGSLGLLTQGITLSSTLTRFATSQTVNQSLTAYVQPILDFYVTPTLSYNFTIRIAQPQMELGAYVTTPILTTGSASATRIADSFSRNNIYTNGLITSSGGTWFVELRNNISYLRDGTTESLFLYEDANNGLVIRPVGGGSRMIIYKKQAGTLTGLYTLITDTVKIAIKWNGSTADVFVNGTKQVSGTAFVTTLMETLDAKGSVVPLFIQAMGLFTTPQTDQFCQDITTL
jgi:hypothetical protein